MAIKGVFFFDFNRSITYNLLIMNGLQRITATKFPFPYVIPNQLLSATDVEVAHDVPVAEIMTRLPVPELATATKRPLP